MPYYYQYQPTIRRRAELIQGKVAAEAYQVFAGEEVYLIDMDNPVVYRKARGFDNILEPLEEYTLTLKEDAPPEEKVDMSQYLTAEEVEKKINEEVEKRISQLSFKPQTKRRKTEEEE